jgi:hypothetical protein
LQIVPAVVAHRLAIEGECYAMQEAKASGTPIF